MDIYNSINNNNNNGDIKIINIIEKEKNAEYWLKKGDICSKNLNKEGAIYCYQQVLFFECTEDTLYYCYKKLFFLIDDFNEKKEYLNKILSLKTVKKTKGDLLRFLTIDIVILIERNPFILVFILWLLGARIFL